MKTRLTILAICALWAQLSQAQEERFDGRPKQTTGEAPTIAKKIKVWKLSEGYTFADSLENDTLVTGFQRHNPMLAKNPMSVYTGNLGAPYQSMVLGEMEYDQDFIFTNVLKMYFPDPDNFLFYNTTVPYTNLTYRTGGPKRRSEENIRVLFTQNVNKRLNVGAVYNLMSSIGRYDAQRADNEMVRLFSSYDGTHYSANLNIAINNANHYENGGLEDEAAILYPNQYGYSQSENIPVNFTSARNRIKNVRFFYNQSYTIGSIAPEDSTGEKAPIPIATAYHTLDFDRYSRIYRINDLTSYYSDGFDDAFYPNIYADTLMTRDTTKYSVVRNMFQLKFNEEANKLLRFGVRAYLLNEIQTYQTQQKPTKFSRVDDISYPEYRHARKTQTSTAVGGQIFKNLGENFWWNAGLKLYVQGYRIGDSEITGNLNSLFKVWNDTAGVFASGGLYLQSPGLLFNDYYSNHFEWHHNFNREKTVKVRGGIRIPTKRFELTGEIRLINDHFYWNQQAMPDQSTGVLKAMEVKLGQHFKIGGFNSINQVWWQATSDAEVMPLPTLAAYTSNFYENVAFKVLRFQIGFDVRYFTAYYTPGYMPATAQFYNQQTRKVGDYPFADVFINFHLKRARIGLKMDHVNQGYPNNDYFLTPGYPANPRSFKISVSWNFYD
ncbi:MAG: putative porin [Breznakibacter sp.]